MLGQWLRDRWNRAGNRWKLLEAPENSWKRHFPRRLPFAAARKIASGRLGPARNCWKQFRAGSGQ
eukprot:9946359-Alexandrium_andersonii.AAC.1